jgi:hypothetical protein
MGYASGFTIWRREHVWTRRKFALRGDATVRTTNHTVPYGTELVSRGYQALRTWLPSFSPFGTTKLRYLSAKSRPHHQLNAKSRTRTTTRTIWLRPKP